MSDINAEREWMAVMSSLACGYGCDFEQMEDPKIELYISQGLAGSERSFAKSFLGSDVGMLAMGAGLHHKLAAEEQRRRLAIYQHDDEAKAEVAA